MHDLLFIALSLAFFATCGGLIRLAERLMPGRLEGPPGIAENAATSASDEFETP